MWTLDTRAWTWRENFRSALVNLRQRRSLFRFVFVVVFLWMVFWRKDKGNSLKRALLPSPPPQMTLPLLNWPSGPIFLALSENNYYRNKSRLCPRAAIRSHRTGLISSSGKQSPSNPLWLNHEWRVTGRVATKRTELKTSRQLLRWQALEQLIKVDVGGWRMGVEGKRLYCSCLRC